MLNSICDWYRAFCLSCSICNRRGYGTKLLVFDQNAGQWLTTALSGKPVTEFENSLLVQFPGKQRVKSPKRVKCSL